MLIIQHLWYLTFLCSENWQISLFTLLHVLEDFIFFLLGNALFANLTENLQIKIHRESRLTGFIKVLKK